jgi:uncharacterized protein (DUF1778 family)
VDASPRLRQDSTARSSIAAVSGSTSNLQRLALQRRTITVHLGKEGSMATKTSRLELRIDDETDEFVTRAAATLHITKSAFVADAARQAAHRVLGRADITVMAPEIFDALMASLDVPDPTAGLDQKLVGLPRVASR